MVNVSFKHIVWYDKIQLLNYKADSAVSGDSQENTQQILNLDL